jgi:phosphatidylinositol alpha-1,6-mannosyltransferase
MAVLVTNDFPPHHGGIQRCMSRIAEELARSDGQVIVVAPAGGASSAYDDAARFRVLRYPAFERITSLLTMTLWLLSARLTARNTYTVASMWFPGGLAACLLPRAIRGRLGILAHGTEIAPGRGGLRRHAMRYVFRQADAIFANSRFTSDLLQRAGVGTAVHIVHLGIDDAQLAPARAAQPTILSVGRLIRRKGFDTVIEALPAVAARFPDVRYEIVGAGPQQAELQALAERLGVARHVVFLGAVDDADMYRAYERAWIFALPVRAVGDDIEGFGLVYLEAALAELPAIGGRGSGAEDAIVDGETGLLVDGTSVAEATDALLALLSDRDRAAAMGARGRRRALDEFTWRKTATEIAQLMQRTVP